MKKRLYLIGAFLIMAGTAKADGLFGASLKPKPNLTLFGQKITWPIPSLCIGGKAGVLPDAKVSSDGISFKVPWFAVDLPFPVLTLKAGKDSKEVTVKVGAIEKSEQKESE